MSTREFDDIIKQKAQQREAAVPPDIWEGIANRKKKRRRPFFWLILLALIAGGAAMLWKTNSSNDVSAVTMEKTNTDKKNTDKKNQEKSIIPEENGNLSQSPDSVKAETGREGEETVKKFDGNDSKTNSNAASIENKTGLAVFKKKAQNDIADSGNEKIFSASQIKRNRRGTFKATVRNGNVDEMADKVKPDSDAADEKKNKVTSKDTNTEPVTVDIDVTDETAAAKQTKTKQPLQTTAVDSPGISTISKQLNEVADKKSAADLLAMSTVTKQVNETADKKAATATKKANQRKKLSGLKIEAAFMAVFPMQQYNQPASVNRILTSPNSSAAFASDNIVTGMETGTGFTVSLVKTLNKKWSAGTGIRYLRFTERLRLSGNETSTQTSIVKRLKEGPGGPFLKDDTLKDASTYRTTLTGRNVYSNFTVPLFVRYRFVSSKKFSAELTTGINISLLRKYQNNIPGRFETVYADGSRKDDSKSTVGLDVFAGLLFSGRLTRKYDWFAASEFYYNLSGYRTGSLSFNKKIHLPAVSFGVSWLLKK
jgi:hypothetical protein